MMTAKSASPAGSLARLLERSKTLHIWVVGDVLMDDYVAGDIDRVSPEAPVQVLNVSSEFRRLGGAANVAHGLARLGARVTLAGVVGDDATAGYLLDQCHREGIRTDAVITVNDRPTIRKLRVMSRHQQMIRLDWERIRPMNAETESRLFEQLCAAPAPDAILLSDYAKGVLTDSLIRKLMQKAREFIAPVVVDPKSERLERYRGALVAAPNLKEFSAALNHVNPSADAADIEAGAQMICGYAGIGALLVTLGESGMALWTPAGGLQAIASTAREVYDVTGAGDTVSAVLALCLAGGLDVKTASLIANTAAGIVVGKMGTATVAADELMQAFTPPNKNKILDRRTLSERLRWWRLKNKRIVFTNGCFDLLHVGHLHVLNQAAMRGDVLLVGLNTDNSIRRLNKGPRRPMIPEQERAAIVAALDCVSAVVLFDEETPLELIKKIQPDVLVKGADYRIDQVVGKEVVEAAGGKVILVDLLPDRSTSLLIEKMCKNV